MSDWNSIAEAASRLSKELDIPFSTALQYITGDKKISKSDAGRLLSGSMSDNPMGELYNASSAAALGGSGLVSLVAEGLRSAGFYDQPSVIEGVPATRPELEDIPYTWEWNMRQVGADPYAPESLVGGMLDPAGMADMAIFAGVRSLDKFSTPDYLKYINRPIKTSHGEKTAEQLRSDLQRAKSLDEKEIDPWDETGWFKGKDGLWRFEIDDSQAELIRDPRVMEESGGVPAEFYIRHENLLDALGGVREEQPIVLAQAYPGGAYSARGDEISVYMDDFGNLPPHLAASVADGEKSTALHEFQHAIQEREGFARGSNASRWQNAQDRPISDIWKERERLMSLPEVREYWATKKSPEYYDELREYNEIWRIDYEPRLKEAEKLLETDPDKWDAATQKVFDDYKAATDGKFPVMEKAQRLYDDIRSRLPSAALSETNDLPMRVSANEAYLREAGETEARNVQKRMNMTPQERRATHPYDTMEYPLVDQILDRFYRHKLAPGAVKY